MTSSVSIKRKQCESADITLPLATNIFIDTTSCGPSTICKIYDSFDILKTTIAGSNLLQMIALGSHQVTIGMRAHSGKSSAIRLDRQNAHKKTVGCATKILLTHETRVSVDFTGNPIESPFTVKLAHELIHGLHNSYGENSRHLPSPNDALWRNLEEYNTIMGNTENSLGISENTIRKELNLPLRYTHLSPAAYQRITHKTSYSQS